MGSEIPLADARLCVQKMVLRLLRISHDAYLPAHHFAVDVDEILLLMGVFIAQAEGRPLTATKLAAFLDMPRTTALRRLAILEREGIIVQENHRYKMSLARLAMKEKVRAARLQIATILKAARQLSKMDTK